MLHNAIPIFPYMFPIVLISLLYNFNTLAASIIIKSHLNVWLDTGNLHWVNRKAHPKYNPN